MKSNFHTIAENFLLTLLSIGKIILMSSFSLKFEKSSTAKCAILGNGPSFNDSFEKYKLQFSDSDIDLFAVNYFCESDRFEYLKPKNYVLNAPEFWLPKVSERHETKRKELINLIVSKTKWEMTIFMPHVSQKYKWFQDSLLANKLIKVIHYNSTPVEGFKFFTSLMFDKKLGMCRPHNVLIPSLFIGIYRKYEEIYLFGADHSWIKNIYVSPQNEVYTKQPHFYDSEVKARPMYKYNKGVEKRRLHEFLEKMVYSFKAYFEINDYAKQKGIKIFNATPNSFIDAFDRKSLTDV